MDLVFFVEEMSTIGCFLPESNQLLESLIMTIFTSVALPCVTGGNDELKGGTRSKHHRISWLRSQTVHCVEGKLHTFHVHVMNSQVWIIE